MSAHKTDIYLWAWWKGSKRAKPQSREELGGGERKGWGGGSLTELRQPSLPLPQKYTSLNRD